MTQEDKPEMKPLPSFTSPLSGNSDEKVVLKGFKPCWELAASPSPFVAKVETWLRFAAIPYELEHCMPQGLPKGKVPSLEHGGNSVPDSAYIVKYLEATYSKKMYEAPSAFRRLSPEQRALSEAFGCLIEDSLLQISIYFRWVIGDETAMSRIDDAVFGGKPVSKTRKPILQGRYITQGLGAHSREDLLRLAEPRVEALATQLGSKPYLLGEAPCAADCQLFALLDGVFYDTIAPADFRGLFEKHAHLKRWTDTIRSKFYKDRLQA